MNVYNSFRFNPLKHHLEWTKEKIRDIINEPDEEKNCSFLNDVSAIGNNILDLYIGQLSCSDIIQQLDHSLVIEGITQISLFSKKLLQQEYSITTLNDGSQWILRLSPNDKVYIHIHPARFGKNTMRVKGTLWKSALIMANEYKGSVPSPFPCTLEINYLRKERLQLSPVKTIHNSVLNDLLTRLCS